MSSRTVKLTLDAKVDGLVNGLRTAKKATGEFTRDLGAWRKKNEEHLDTLGSAAGKSGLAITAGLGLVGKAAMDWQSDWTGVLKTVDGTPEQLGKVEDGLRGLAKTLPSSHREIAGVAEAAGQLGVATGDVVDFTKVMIDLGESTNMSAETAATQLARFSNIMGTSTDDVGRLGATLVGLGNNFATTESEIMDMSMRLAGAGKQIGLSEGQTMGLAAAMSSVGIEAEAGGSAMSMTMKKVSKAVDEGGSSLETFASVSGMTAEQFATLWKKDAAAGLEAFTLGLGEVGASGESVNAVLTELGITGIRESDALLRLSSAGELMGNSMRQGSQEFADGSALIEEATKRYETAESKVKMAWNGIKDAAITAGSLMLPVIANVADGVSGLADWFGSIPAPIQGFVLALGGITGAGLLAIAGLITISKKVNELTTAFAAITPAGGRAAGAITGVGKALSGAMIVGAALVAGKSIIEGINTAAREGKPDLQEYFNLLATGGGKDLAGGLKFDLGDGARTGLSQFEGITKEAQVANRALERLGTMNDALLGRWWSENISMGDTRREIDEALELEKALQALARSFEMGEVGKSQKAFADFATELGFTDEKVAEIINRVPELKDALTNVATEGGIKLDPDNELGLVDLALGRIAVSGEGAADALTKTGEAGQNASGGTDAASVSIRGVAMSAEDAEKAVEDFYDALVAVGAIALSERDALRGLEESFDTAAEAAKKNGKNLDTTTEKGRANEAALDGIASATLRAVEAQEAQGRSAGDLAATMEVGRDAYIKQAVAMGMPKKAAEELANQLNLIPEAVFMQFETNTEGVTARVSELYDWVKAAPDGKIEVHENTPEVRLALEKLGLVVKELPDGTIQVSEKGAKETGKKIDDVAKKKREAPIDAKAITGAAEAALNELARSRTATINTHYTESGAIGGQSGSGAKATVTRKAAMATGGPVFGPGTGTSDSIPALLSNGEHVWTAEEVRRLGGHDKVESLRSLAMQGKLPAFAKGGAVGSYTIKRGDTLSGIAKQFGTTWRELQRINKIQNADRIYAGQTIDLPGGGASKAKAKPAPKPVYATSRAGWAEKERDQDAREVKAATAELTAAKRTKNDKKIAAAEKNLDKAKKSYDDSKERVVRLREKEFDLRRDLKRGNIVDAFTSGSGMSVVDQLFDQSNNMDLSKKQRATLRSTAYSMESQLLKLEKQSDKLSVSLGKAADKRDDLLSARNSVRDSMVGAFDLGGLAGQKDAYGYDTSVGKKGLLNYGKSMASGAKKLSSKVAALQKAGFHPSMIEQVISEWTSSGTFELADAMLSMNKSERSSFNSSFKSVERYGLSTGTSLTNAMAKGGINAAEGLVKGLTSQQKKVDNAFYKLGKDAEKSFKRSLGIKSPSTVMFGAGVNVGEGAELGILSKVSDVQGAMGMLAEAPAFSVPPSAEVARYTAQPAVSAGVVIDYDRLAQAMTNVQLNANLQIDRKQAGTLVQAGQKFNGNH